MGNALAGSSGQKVGPSVVLKSASQFKARWGELGNLDGYNSLDAWEEERQAWW